MEVQNTIESKTPFPPFPELPLSPAEQVEAIIRQFVLPLADARSVIEALESGLRPNPSDLEQELEDTKAKLDEATDAATSAAEDYEMAGAAIEAAVELVIDNEDGRPVDRAAVIAALNEANDSLNRAACTLRNL